MMTAVWKPLRFLRMTGATEDDLNVLVIKGFVRLLNEDLVAYITDWQANNQIRKDRYHEGRYQVLDWMQM